MLKKMAKVFNLKRSKNMPEGGKNVVLPSPWQPDKQTVEEMTTFLENKFPQERSAGTKPDKDFITDCAKISAFLLDEKAVTAQLKRLEQLLQEKIKKMYPNQEIKEIPVSVLRETLETELGKLGFDPHFAKALDVITPAQFREMLRLGIVVKDIALGKSNHGEFTHAIQWLLIGWQQQESGKNVFLKKDVATIYKELGEEKSVIKETRIGEENLWDSMVDVIPLKSKSKKDCRVPDFLSTFIMNDGKNEFPWLSGLLNKRQEKRQDQNITQLKKKYFEKSLKGLGIFSSKHKEREYVRLGDETSNLFVNKKSIEKK